MTPNEVVWYANHKYGEMAYMVETKDAYLIFTTESQWRIYKKDKERFGTYCLYHMNHVDGTEKGFHVQCKLPNCSCLTYIAVMHDKCKRKQLPLKGDMNEYNDFQNQWHIFRLGRDIESDIAAWDYMTKDVIECDN